MTYRDQYGNEYERINSSGGGCIIGLVVFFTIIGYILKIGFQLAVLLIPIVPMWLLLYKVKVVKSSLNKFKRLVLLLWFSWDYLLTMIPKFTEALSNMNMGIDINYYDMYNFVALTYKPFLFTLVAIGLIAFDMFQLKNRGLNYWSGLRKNNSSIDERLIGYSMFILLFTFAIFCNIKFLFVIPYFPDNRLATLLTNLYINSFIVTIIGYFVMKKNLLSDIKNK